MQYNLFSEYKIQIMTIACVLIIRSSRNVDSVWIDF
jgi:hypothetical protein